MKIVCEQRCDERFRTFQNGNIGTIRIINNEG
jgi:hypothetical protein